MNSFVSSKFRYILSVLVVLFMVVSCVSTSGTAKESGEELVYQNDFEKDALGWGTRGSETVELVDKAGIDGGQALYVHEREKTWNAPFYDMTEVLLPGASYRIGVWVKFEEGPQSSGFNMSVQVDNGTGMQYVTIGGGRVPKNYWTYMETVYTVPPKADPNSAFLNPIGFYIETPWKPDESIQPEDIISFYIDNVTVSKIPPAAPAAVETDIPEFSSFFDFPVGTAVNSQYLKDGHKRHGLLRHFNAYVYENEMKMDAMQPREGEFKFANGDALVEYASSQGKLVRGHTLLWHNQYPSWFFTDDEGNEVSKEVLMNRIEAHISTIVSHYKGQIYAWDVVNEVVEYDGSLRNSPYLSIIGSEEYIALAFRAARAADPDAKLFINDYNIAFSGAKQDALYELVKRLKDQGVPIDGVGLQAHINMGHPTVGNMETAIERFASLGVDVHVTELDMSVYASENEAAKDPGREVLLTQAYKYRDMFEMFSEQHAKGNLDMVVFWGADDGMSWKNQPGRPDYPLLFGKDLQAKPAYWIFADPARLPINIQVRDSNQAVDGVSGMDDPIWENASSYPIVGRDGTLYGSFKTLWDDKKLYVLATALDNTSDSSDEIVFYVEPRNVKADERTKDSIDVSVSRSKADADTGESYTVFKALNVEGILDAKVGFDVVVSDNGSVHSWNDFDNLQEDSSINYGTLCMKPMPVMCTAKRATGNIRIDGRDSEWGDITPVPMEVETQGYTLEGSQFRAQWDDNYLYVYFEVQDSLLNDNARDPWEQDSVEVFIDQNNAKTSTYEPDDAQYRISFKNFVTFNGGYEDEFMSKTRVFPGGYAVEVAVPLKDVSPEVGLLMGFDTQINEADASGVRAGIRNWVNDTNMGYQDMSGLGVIMLVE